MDAKEVMASIPLPSVAYVEQDGLRYDDRYYGKLTDALHVAGLLVTDLHKRALEVAEAYRHDGVAFDPKGCMPAAACRALNALDSIGMESLAAKEAAKPKPRWRKVDCRIEDTVGKRFLDGF